MAFVHGRNTYISLNSVVLSTFVNSSNLDQEADEHDVTCYGASNYTYTGGLLKGACSISGVYDSGASGPRATIEALIGTVTTLIRGPEGNATGKPKETVQVHVKKYTETNPVADMVSWSCDLTLSGPITRATW